MSPRSIQTSIFEKNFLHCVSMPICTLEIATPIAISIKRKKLTPYRSDLYVTVLRVVLKTELPHMFLHLIYPTYLTMLLKMVGYIS